MQSIWVQILVAGGVMGVLDFIWLSVVAKNFYRAELGSALLDKPNMLAAVLFYIIYIVGVVAFVIAPALDKGSWSHAVLFGALFGLVAYATYDLTNLATLKAFTPKLVAVDLIWGAALTATVAAVTYWVVS